MTKPSKAAMEIAQAIYKADGGNLEVEELAAIIDGHPMVESLLISAKYATETMGMMSVARSDLLKDILNWQPDR